MISLEGIVTKMLSSYAHICSSIHYCETEEKFFFQDYRDQTNTSSGMPTTTVYPTEDSSKHPV